MQTKSSPQKSSAQLLMDRLEEVLSEQEAEAMDQQQVVA